MLRPRVPEPEGETIRSPQKPTVDRHKVAFHRSNGVSNGDMVNSKSVTKNVAINENVFAAKEDKTSYEDEYERDNDEANNDNAYDDDDDDDDDDDEVFRPTAPLDSRPTSRDYTSTVNNNTTTTPYTQPHIKKKFRLPATLLPNGLILLSNVIVFASLMWFRRFNKLESPFEPIISFDLCKTIAKNSAILTLVNMFGVFVSLAFKTRLAHVIFVFWMSGFALIHTVSHVIIGYQLDLVDYLRKNIRLSVSGVLMIIIIAQLCVSKCLKNYSTFYIIHVTSSLILMIACICHSYWFALAFSYPIVLVFIRSLRRWFLNIELKPITVGDTFIFFELIIDNTFINRLLALNYLRKHNGNVVSWMSCKSANSVFERHPFSILKTYEKRGHYNSQIIMSKFGDWKLNLYSLIRANYSKSLYSCGVECYLDAFVTDENLRIFKDHSHILFILENLDVARFLSFVTLINDSHNYKLRTIVRHIELHFKFDDYLLHDIIREYTLNSLVNSHSSSFHLSINLYYVTDLNSPNLTDRINSPHVRYVTLKRLNHNIIVQNFVARYSKDKLANKRASLKIVSTEERKVSRAVKRLTSHRDPIIVI